ncbi:MAG: hypothetical protein ACK50N_06410 [Flavobacteriales bacterium]|jgi:hypothetical protein
MRDYEPKVWLNIPVNRSGHQAIAIGKSPQADSYPNHYEKELPHGSNLKQM